MLTSLTYCHRYPVLICIGQPSEGLRGWAGGLRATCIYIPLESPVLGPLRIRLLSPTLPNICLFVPYPIACLQCPHTYTTANKLSLITSSSSSTSCLCSKGKRYLKKNKLLLLQATCVDKPLNRLNYLHNNTTRVI
jgi:hypothetical protein